MIPNPYNKDLATFLQFLKVPCRSEGSGPCVFRRVPHLVGACTGPDNMSGLGFRGFDPARFRGAGLLSLISERGHGRQCKATAPHQPQHGIELLSAG